MYLISQEGKIIWSVKTLSEVNSVAISFDGKYITAGTNNGLIYIISQTGEILCKSKRNDGVINVKINPDGNYIVAGSREGGVYLISNIGQQLWKSLDDKGIYSVSISQDGTLIAAGSLDRIYLISNNGKNVWTYQTFDDKDYMYSINSLAISLDSSTLVSTSREKVFLFDIGQIKEFDMDNYIPIKEENSKGLEPNQSTTGTKENPVEKPKGILDIILSLLGIKK